MKEEIWQGTMFEALAHTLKQDGLRAVQPGNNPEDPSYRNFLAQGPEWDAWETYGNWPHGRVRLRNGSRSIVLTKDMDTWELWFYYMEKPVLAKHNESPDAIRIYAEGLLRLEAELEASE
jgi:hypothetical protein